MSALPDDVLRALLDRGEVYEVGGSVRDGLLERRETQLDADYVVCGLEYDSLCDILQKFGRADVVGRSFGVVKFVPRGWSTGDAIDVALPRTERSTGVGHRDFAVASDPRLPIEEDLRRRDFTVNAIARDLRDERVVDPTYGRSDLDARLVRMVFPRAFEEDPLRMLRGAVLAARLDFEIEPATLDAMRTSARLIATVAPERVLYELDKLWTCADRPSIALRVLQSTGVLSHLMPEVDAMSGVEQPGGFHAHDVFEHTLLTVDASPRDSVVRWAALLHDVGKPATKTAVEGGATYYGHDTLGERTARAILMRLRASNELIDDVCVLVRNHMWNAPETDKGLRRLIRRVGPERVFKLLELRKADVIAQAPGREPSDVDAFADAVRAVLEAKHPLELADLRVDGDDVMREFDLSPGPRVGEILAHLLEFVLDDPARNEREVLLEEARRFVNEGRNT